MSAGAVRLPRTAEAAIRTHAEAAWPVECCGLLTGRGAEGGRAAFVVAAAHPCRNLAADPAREFEVDPQAWLDLRTALETAGRGEAIIGCYHSHPGGPAAPSQRDLDEAWEPGFLWLVIAVAQGRATAMTAHVFECEAGGQDAPRRFRRLALDLV